MARSVGKRIGGVLYLHRSAVGENALVESAAALLPDGFRYEVVKINEKSREVSFIDSPDWDTAPEPMVGDSCRVRPDTGEITFRSARKRNPQIYHHKWMFVADDYQGFSVEESKQRSDAWMHSGIPYDSKRIGNLDYWKENVSCKL